MNIAIRYYSLTGNTEKVAHAIAEVAGVPAQTFDVPLEGDVDILFLGSAPYAFSLDQKVKDFIDILDPLKVKNVVCFSTAALLPSTYGAVSKLLKKKGIPVDVREFHCKGQFNSFHKGRPNVADLAGAKTFAMQILGK